MRLPVILNDNKKMDGRGSVCVFKFIVCGFCLYQTYVCVCVLHVCAGAHVCSGWYLLWVALAVFAYGWRRGVVVEDRTGQVVDHQHLPL